MPDALSVATRPISGLGDRLIICWLGYQARQIIKKKSRKRSVTGKDKIRSGHLLALFTYVRLMTNCYSIISEMTDNWHKQQVT